jgi:hypothetical protein
MINFDEPLTKIIRPTKREKVNCDYLLIKIIKEGFNF